MPSPKILLLDIETAPKKAWVWGMFKQTVGLSQLVDDWYMLCWCAKWLGDKKVMSSAIWDFKRHYSQYPEDDFLAVEKLHELMCEADIIVAHNGDRFDVPSVNTRFVIHGMQPPDKYQTYDTLKAARSNFKFTSNRLDALGRFLGVGRKVETGGFDLWAKCLDKDKKSQKKMVDYCKQDVNLLEEVYLKLRPWDSRHPNVTIYGSCDRPRCNVCGSEHVHSKGLSYTRTQFYRRWKCQECGHNMRSRFTEVDKEQRKNILTST